MIRKLKNAFTVACVLAFFFVGWVAIGELGCRLTNDDCAAEIIRLMGETP